MLNNFTRPAEGIPSIVCDLRRVNETKVEFEYNLKPLTYYGGKPSLWFYTARDTVPVPKTVGNLFSLRNSSKKSLKSRKRRSERFGKLVWMICRTIPSCRSFRLRFARIITR